MFHGENDRVKLLVLYSGMLDDERLVRAASGALAMIAHDRVVSNKITTVSGRILLLLLKVESVAALDYSSCTVYQQLPRNLL